MYFLSNGTIMNYPTPTQIKDIVLRAMTIESYADIDELVYDKISDFDQYFEGDTGWYNEEDTETKDSLQDQVLELLEKAKQSIYV